VAIQQRVTSNLLVTFATDITSTQRQAIQMNTSSIQNGQSAARATRTAGLAWKEGTGRTSKKDPEYR
jgi:hypothetical protein